MKRWSLRALTGALLLILGSPVLAEVSVNRQGHPLILYGQGPWTAVRQGVEDRFLLNPSGDLKGDGVPFATVSPLTGYAEVVWSSQENGSFDIAFASWDGQIWRKELINLPGNGILPHLVHDEWGNRFLAWIENSRVVVAGSPYDQQSFTIPRTLDGSTGVKELALLSSSNGELVVAWLTGTVEAQTLSVAEIEVQRDANYVLLGGGMTPMPVPRALTILDLDTDGFIPFHRNLGLLTPGSSLTVHSQTSSSGKAAEYLAIHQEDGILWLDWIEGKRMRFTTYQNGEFSDIESVSLKDRSAASLAAARRRVKQHLVP